MSDWSVADWAVNLMKPTVHRPLRDLDGKRARKHIGAYGPARLRALPVVWARPCTRRSSP